jgi:hypothetical protein
MVKFCPNLDILQGCLFYINGKFTGFIPLLGLEENQLIQTFVNPNPP